ncbi:MAG: hypothetical protein RIQ88_678 [Actinomycetota bacterium]
MDPLEELKFYFSPLGLVVVLITGVSGMIATKYAKKRIKRTAEKSYPKFEEFEVAEVSKIWIRQQLKNDLFGSIFVNWWLAAMIIVGLLAEASDYIPLYITAGVILLVGVVVGIKTVPKKNLPLAAYEEDFIDALRTYYKAHQKELVDEALKDPEVIEALAKYPKMVQRRIKTRAYAKSTYPSSS